MTIRTPQRRELVSERARTAVRDLMSGTTLREIDELWQDELFAPVFDDPEPVGGQRVTHFQGYMDQVDWTDPIQVSRALRVFEAALAFAFVPGAEYPNAATMARLRRLWERDGYEWTDEGKIVGGPTTTVVATELLDNLSDPRVIRDHLDRIERAVAQADPSLAIGSAKELIESTAKLALGELGEEVPSGAEVSDLVRRVQEALAIHPSKAAPGPDGSDGVKKILGASVTIANSVAELRNSYGTGHGKDVTHTGLGARHARLVVNAARMWVEFVLDTLSDEKAPWRKASAGTKAH
ncbi:hypothetical protein GC089_18100 [Cellulomonas sp. JZ18]|uniref:abortive infection family protein n=1 Tax=Cellulomonas sp. JZ18 TaxID=2654191 RepID=UPI0012D3A4EF|nr:abortive infection family protein [Cellulomonas sp. JZ18]QGQ20753.1 hypothetical protein GC089_18100 [Cellulomonas sp. JZ18]